MSLFSFTDFSEWNPDMTRVALNARFPLSTFSHYLHGDQTTQYFPTTKPKETSIPSRTRDSLILKNAFYVRGNDPLPYGATSHSVSRNSIDQPGVMSRHPSYWNFEEIWVYKDKRKISFNVLHSGRKATSGQYFFILSLVFSSVLRFGDNISGWNDRVLVCIASMFKGLNTLSSLVVDPPRCYSRSHR